MDPNQRIKAYEALMHEYFDDIREPIIDGFHNGMRAFSPEDTKSNKHSSIVNQPKKAQLSFNGVP